MSELLSSKCCCGLCFACHCQPQRRQCTAGAEWRQSTLRYGLHRDLTLEVSLSKLNSQECQVPVSATLAISMATAINERTRGDLRVASRKTKLNSWRWYRACLNELKTSFGDRIELHAKSVIRKSPIRVNCGACSFTWILGP